MIISPVKSVAFGSEEQNEDFFPLPSSDTDVTSGFADEALFSHADKLGNQKECPVTPRVAGYAKYGPFFTNT